MARDVFPMVIAEINGICKPCSSRYSDQELRRYRFGVTILHWPRRHRTIVAQQADLLARMRDIRLILTERRYMSGSVRKRHICRISHAADASLILNPGSSAWAAKILCFCRFPHGGKEKSWCYWGGPHFVGLGDPPVRKIIRRTNRSGSVVGETRSFACSSAGRQAPASP